MNLAPPPFRNSAGRLLAILYTIQANENYVRWTSRVDGQSTSNKRVHQVLNEFYGVWEEVLADLDAAQIAGTMRTAISEGIGGIGDRFNPGDLGGTVPVPTAAQLSVLKICATAIPEDGELESSEIEKVERSVADLREALLKTDLAPALRKVLLELVRLSQDSINRYHVSGPRGLKKAFKTMLGEAGDLFFHADAQEKRDWEAQGISSIIVSHLKVIDQVASKVLQYQPAIEWAAQIFLPSQVK